MAENGPSFALASYGAAGRSWLQEDNSWRKTTGHGASQTAFKPSRITGVFLFNWLNFDKLILRNPNS